MIEFQLEATPYKGNLAIYGFSSADIINERNDMIIARFFYYKFLKKMPLQNAMQLICTEFVLVFNELSDFLESKEQQIQELKKASTSINMLEGRYPFFKW